MCEKEFNQVECLGHNTQVVMNTDEDKLHFPSAIQTDVLHCIHETLVLADFAIQLHGSALHEHLSPIDWNKPMLV